MGARYECKWCGVGFEPTCHTSRQIYCSSECRVKSNNTKRYAPPNDECVYCGCRIERRENSGRYRRFCGESCRKTHHRELAAQRKREFRAQPRVCPYCGREFLPAWESGMLPRFCSDECRVAWWREHHKAALEPTDTPAQCGYCGKALESIEKKYCGRACYRLGVARVRGERCCVWCGKLLSKKARNNQKYCSASCAGAASYQSKAEKPAQHGVTAKNPAAWRKQLMNLSKNGSFSHQKDRRILLVCDTMSLVSTDTLVNFIRYQLRSDPFDGNIYVFCGRSGMQLKWLFWDGSGFCEGMRSAECGRYPWPKNNYGALMEITAQEFEFLRSQAIGISKMQNG